MKYMGSKNRIAKHILPIMLKEVSEKNLKTWVEPFVGGANMIDKVPRSLKRVGIDYNAHTIEALIAIRDLVEKLPDSLTEEQYKDLKDKPPEPVTSWLRFVASFGGKFDGGYAREKGSHAGTFVGYGLRNAKKQSPLLRGVVLVNGSYDDYSDLKDCLIYCDPPYAGTTSYKTSTFNHDRFWQWCRDMSKNNSVFISEYQAPADFETVWEGVVATNFASSRKQATHQATEKLFRYRPCY